MKPWKLVCTGLALAGLAPAVLAQGNPAVTPQPPGVLSDAVVGPSGSTLSTAALAKPADSVEGAAARLQLDEADAAARRAAIRYLAGADCRYWPEVTDALIGALRCDRNESVRLEAALALAGGSCCNRATLLALTLTVSGSEADGNPAENSDRIKAAALAALNQCLETYPQVAPAPEAPLAKTNEPAKESVPPTGEPAPPNADGAARRTAGVPDRLPGAVNRSVSPAEFYHHPENLQEAAVVAEARRVAAHVKPALRAPAASAAGLEPVRYSTSSWKTPDAFAGSAPSSPLARIPAFLPPIPPPGGAGPAPVPTHPAGIPGTISILQDSIYPEEREKAAAALGGCDGWANPKVVQALVVAAKSDAAPVVRAACLRSLTRLNVRTLPVAAAAQALKTDPDPRVRTEAAEALQKLGAVSGQQ